MQALPQTDKKHLSHDAALLLLAVLPDHIRDAYLNHAKQIAGARSGIGRLCGFRFTDFYKLQTSDRFTDGISPSCISKE